MSAALRDHLLTNPDHGFRIEYHGMFLRMNKIPAVRLQTMQEFMRDATQQDVSAVKYGAELQHHRRSGSTAKKSVSLNKKRPGMEEYYERQLSENKISIFKNWSALCLFDTFTRISLNYPDKFNSWENEQFNIYIHSLYLKFYMYLANTQISHITEVSGETQKIRDGFVQFINEYYMSHISYKWLANEIHDKLLIGLDAKGELEKMEVKIKRINEYFREKRSKRLNRLLLTIALINIISVFLNSWNLKKLGAYFPRVIEYLSEIFNNLL